MMERIKARFTFNDLKDSSRYYFPIMDRLDNKTDVGSDFSVIFDTIMISNRAFIKLLSDAEMYAAYALVRLQLDNLLTCMQSMNSLQKCCLLHKVMKQPTLIKSNIMVCLHIFC